MSTREGNLDAPTRHPLDWLNPKFHDEQDCLHELERIFDICHGCRRCVSLCQAFPTLFDLVDESGTGEVDARMQVNGESRIRETAVHGVWWSEHRDSDGALLATVIEVTRVPDILIVAEDDLLRGAARLRASLTLQSAAQGENPHGKT